MDLNSIHDVMNHYCHQSHVSTTGYNLTDLDPYSRYAVSAVMLNKDSEGPRSEELFASTVEEGKDKEEDEEEAVSLYFYR